MKVLALAGSPRRQGNTDLLLERALAGAQSFGAVAETVVLSQQRLHPCRHCDGCLHSGVCVIKDEMQPLHHQLRTCDRLVLASPIFFMSVTAQAKIAIDRCQALWAAKYLLKQRHPYAEDGSRRRGLFIAAGGLSRPDLFDCARTTVRAFFATCDVQYSDEVFFSSVDEKGAIKQHPTALDDAFAAGVRLVQG